jgi:hypothetical protein
VYKGIRPETQQRGGAAEIWSGHPGVAGYLGALGRYLAGTGRQFSADLNGEVQVRLAAGPVRPPRNPNPVLHAPKAGAAWCVIGDIEVCMHRQLGPNYRFTTFCAPTGFAQ